jgi:protocatechuate 3,4-dioxygenase beta subunit
LDCFIGITNSMQSDKALSLDLPRITRRSLFGAAGSLVLAYGAQAPAIVTSKNRVQSAGCMLAPEQEEGPYYVDQALIRSDITEGRPGIPLRLRIVVLDGGRCTPIKNAAVNIWHCDAGGIYSGYTSNNPAGPPFGGGHRPPGPPPEGFRPGGDGPPPPPFHHGPTDNTRFFRGVQLTDSSGVTEFATIYPGWYMGRDIHIHMKVQTSGSVKDGHYLGGHVSHTGQLFFPEDISDAVSRLQPYASHRIERTRQEEDDIFTSQHGSDFVVALVQTNKRSMTAGFVATAAVGIDPNAEPAPARRTGPPPAAPGF